MWLFYYFNFERNYDVLKPKSPCFLLKQKYRLVKDETESKMKNPTHSFRKMNLVLQLVKELRIKSKTVMNNLIKKETPAQGFSCDFCEKSKNTSS